MGWIETYLNDPEVKAALGVNPQRKFESCNMAVNQAFMLQGDSMHNTPLLLQEMINDGVRLLVYAGNAGEGCFCIVSSALLNTFLDMMCNYMVGHAGFGFVAYNLTPHPRAMNVGSNNWTPSSLMSFPLPRLSSG
jgi:hypothetical protein